MTETYCSQIQQVRNGVFERTLCNALRLATGPFVGSADRITRHSERTTFSRTNWFHHVLIGGALGQRKRCGSVLPTAIPAMRL